MSTIKTGYWVRAQNGVVTDCWDYKPSDDKMASEPGWREAVEVIPDTVPNREYVSTHTFDLSKTPAEIVWAKGTYSVEDRRGSLKSQAKGVFNQAVQEQARLETNDNPDQALDLEAITTARATLTARLAALDAAVTHEDIDALM
jgi:hypothetical protein